MKIVCQRERLHNALQVVGATVGPSTTKPVLQDVKLEAADDALGLVATDLEVGVRYRLADVEVAQAGSALVPARRLMDIVRNATDEAIELEWADSILEIRGRSSRFRILGEDPEEFPGIPEVDESGAGGFAADVLIGMLRRTLFAAAAQSTRYTLNGVYWEADGKSLAMTATDGHRLAHVERTLSTPVAEAVRGIVPAKAAALMAHSLRPDENVTFRFGENDLLVRTDRLTIYARLLEGTFPRYREVIPTGSTVRVEAPVRELEQCVRQAAVLTSDESRAVRFHFETNHLTLRSRTPEAGEAQVELAVTYTGDPMVIGFNPKFVADALAPIDEETVRIELASPDQPGLIKDGTGYLCVIMPLNLAEEPPAPGAEEDVPEAAAEEGLPPADEV